MIQPRPRRPAPRIVLMTAPFAGQVERTIEIDRPRTIAAVIRREKIRFRVPTIAVVTGKDEPAPVLRADWPARRIRRGETLTFIAVPGKGNGGSSTGKQVAGIIATIALSVAAPWAGGAFAGALGLTGTALKIGTAIASAAFLVGGALLLSAVSPKPQTPFDGGQGQPVYSSAASSNQALPLGTIPCPYGENRFPPPLAARPYSEFVGNDQFLYQLHCYGLGKSQIAKWEIGDTTAWTSAEGMSAAFPGAEIEIVHPGGDVTLFPANVVSADEVGGQTVPSPAGQLGPFVVNAAGTQISRIAIDVAFPGGIFRITHTGAVVSGSRRLIAEYREIDDSGDPLGSFQELFDKSYVNTTRTPQRITEAADVPAGRYEVLLRGDQDYVDAGQEGANGALWVGLRGYLENFQTPPGVTLIATKIKASEQISQVSASQYFFTGTRMLPAWDASGEEWSAPVATRSIAWAAADYLRNTDYGLGLADAKFDRAWLVAYHAVWEGRGDRFDAVFDRKWVAYQGLAAILAAGRAQPVRLGGTIGFVRDEPKLVRRHVFTPRNVVRGSISRRLVLFDEEAPDHVIARYFDRTVAQERTVDCVVSAVGDAEPAELDLFGITDRDHAWREGTKKAAENAYRRDFRSFNVHREGRLLVRGDPILLHDPLLQENAQISALEERAGDTLTLDREIAPGEADEHYALIRDKRGREWGPCLVDTIAGRTVVLNAADRALVEADHGALDDVLPGARREPAHVSILAGETSLWDGLIVSAAPRGAYFEVLCVNDDQRVHLADQTEIVPAPYTPPALFAPVPEAPVIDPDGFYALARNGTVHIELEAGWRPAPGAVRYVAEISYDSTADEGAGAGVDPVANPEQAAWTPVHDSVGTRFTAVITPRPFVLRAAAIGVRQGPWAYKTVSEVPAPALAPGTVTEEALDAAFNALLDQLRVSRAAALGPVLDELRTVVDQLAQDLNGMVAVQDLNVQDSIISYIGKANSRITDVRTVTQDLADLYLLVETGDEQTFANALQRFTATVFPGGAGAMAEWKIRAGKNGVFASCGARAIALVDDLGNTQGIFEVEGDKFFFVNAATGERVPLHLVALQTAPVTWEIPASGPLEGTLKIDISGRRRKHRVLVTQSSVVDWPTGVTDSDTWEVMYQFQSGGLTLVHTDERYLTPHPVLGPEAGDIVVLVYSAQREFETETLVATVGVASGGQTIAPEKNLLTFIQDAAADANLLVALDPATELSYDPGANDTLVVDLTGNGNNFTINSAGGFNGTPGGLSGDEFFEGVYLQQTADHTFAETFHQDNAKFTIGSLVRLPASMGTDSWVPIFNDLRITNAGGSNRNLFGLSITLHTGDGLPTPPSGVNTGLYLSINIFNMTTGAGLGNGNVFSRQISIDSGLLGDWHLLTFALDETVGANGLTVGIDVALTKYSSTYSSPSSSGTIEEYRMGAIRERVSSGLYVPGSGIPTDVAWGPWFAASRRWSDAEIEALYARIKLERPEYGLP